MGSFRLSLPLLPILLLLLAIAVAAVAAGGELRTFIVHVRPHKSHVFGTTHDRTTWYKTFLPEDERLVHSYHHVASGFAARLTEQELDALSAKPGFVTAVPSQVYRLLTTNTPQFLGLELPKSGRNYTSEFGEGVIIGVLDTGVFPFHPSFGVDGMPPPPAKWKGRCDLNASACNNKLIGARSFVSNSSALDEDGHGTHTSSTAAGAVVPGAQVLGQAAGTASGIAPHAHVAMYKVCNEEGCESADILAGIDAAVGDGCDVLSMSIGGQTAPFFEDSIAIGTFAAVEKGVFVSLAAGNAGPGASTLSNDAPWMLTVAAGTMDRLIAAQVRLGNGSTFDGESVFQPNIPTNVTYPLVFAGASAKPNSSFCVNGSLDGFDVVGKIVLCDRGNNARLEKGDVVKSAGGFGMILANEITDGYSTLADAHVLPASHVSYAAGVAIKEYINSTANPVAQIIFKGTELGTSPAPAITSFSSRGPSVQNPGILKPDITGPGVSVLAAWPFQVGPPSSEPAFNLESGTSMSTPHLSGVAALIKSKHPDWSPSAIKSAIMTTADPDDKSGKPIVDEQNTPASLFATGAGQVNPDNALDPGLVYDIAPAEYIGFLCSMYTSQQVSVIARRSIDCSTITVIPAATLNYPSITVTLPAAANSTAPVVVSRTVKNVGEAPAVYYPRIAQPGSVQVEVTPSSLQFTEANQPLNFTVSLLPGQGTDAKIVEGSLSWESDKHTVRSPISIYFA